MCDQGFFFGFEREGRVEEISGKDRRRGEKAPCTFFFSVLIPFFLISLNSYPLSMGLRRKGPEEGKGNGKGKGKESSIEGKGKGRKGK